MGLSWSIWLELGLIRWHCPDAIHVAGYPLDHLVKKHAMILPATVLQNVKVIWTLVFAFRGNMSKEQFLLAECTGKEKIYKVCLTEVTWLLCKGKKWQVFILWEQFAAETRATAIEALIFALYGRSAIAVVSPIQRKITLDPDQSVYQSDQ